MAEQHFAFALLLSRQAAKLVKKMADKNQHIKSQLSRCSRQENNDGYLLFISEWDKSFDWDSFKSMFKSFDQRKFDYFFVKESNMDVVIKGHHFINPFNFSIERRFLYTDKDFNRAIF